MKIFTCTTNNCYASHIQLARNEQTARPNKYPTEYFTFRYTAFSIPIRGMPNNFSFPFLHEYINWFIFGKLYMRFHIKWNRCQFAVVWADADLTYHIILFRQSDPGHMAAHKRSRLTYPTPKHTRTHTYRHAPAHTCNMNTINLLCNQFRSKSKFNFRKSFLLSAHLHRA